MVGFSLYTGKLNNIKFLCSYGGKIIPRYPDGKLRYYGGETRVLAVDRLIPFSELLLKLGELCGTSVVFRCQLPTEDLDALVSITSDEDLANLIEEYDRCDQAVSPPFSLKIRAFLFQSKKVSHPLPPKLASSSKSLSSSSGNTAAVSTPRFSVPTAGWCLRHYNPAAFHPCLDKSARRIPHYAHGIPNHIYLVHNGNHWQ